MSGLEAFEMAKPYAGYDISGVGGASGGYPLSASAGHRHFWGTGHRSEPLGAKRWTELKMDTAVTLLSLGYKGYFMDVVYDYGVPN